MVSINIIEIMNIIEIDELKEHSGSSSTGTSVDSINRKELLWETREEAVVEKWKKHCSKQSQLHGVKARQIKQQYKCLSIPAILIPVGMSSFSSYLLTHPIVTSACLMTVSIFTGLNGFLNLGARTQAHFNSEGLYGDLALGIETEMCRPKRYRLACDVFLERTRSAISKLDLNSPNL